MAAAGTPTARILIVDDEVPQMKALCDTLRDQGYDTFGFSSPRAALAAMREEKFDLLLADLMMPEMDGIALLKAAQELDPTLVGIIMTGEGTITSAVEAMKTGALDYILKPFRLSVIYPVLARALTVRRLRMENAELQERLRERAVELEAANKELESFSYSVSHDLRAPLRAINGFSTIVVEEYAAQLPDEAQRLLGSVIRGARRMEQLIDDLLQFSRFARQPLSKQSVNVLALVQELVDELQKEQGDRKVEVRVGALANCVADLALLRQVFANLLSNAFKYTGKVAQPAVEVGYRLEEGRHVYFVRDNGAGFDMQYAHKLFGVFQRLHSADEFKGTGIGLSIVQRVIQRHGGRVWVEAEVNKGATFYFDLPTE